MIIAPAWAWQPGGGRSLIWQLTEGSPCSPTRPGRPNFKPGTAGTGPPQLLPGRVRVPHHSSESDAPPTLRESEPGSSRSESDSEALPCVRAPGRLRHYL